MDHLPDIIIVLFLLWFYIFFTKFTLGRVRCVTTYSVFVIELTVKIV
jgi:hypothetical protein